MRVLKLVYNRLKGKNASLKPAWPKLPVLVAFSLEEAHSLETGYAHPKLPELKIMQARSHREEFGRFAREHTMPGEPRFFQHF